jgi:DNA mismatch endonuclease (patch repair protein)
MSRIKSRNTKPEMLVRKFLHANGFRYRLHVKNLPGKPDIVLPIYKTLVFVMTDSGIKRTKVERRLSFLFG